MLPIIVRQKLNSTIFIVSIKTNLTANIFHWLFFQDPLLLFISLILMDYVLMMLHIFQSQLNKFFSMFLRKEAIQWFHHFDDLYEKKILISHNCLPEEYPSQRQCLRRIWPLEVQDLQSDPKWLLCVAESGTLKWISKIGEEGKR